MSTSTYQYKLISSNVSSDDSNNTADITVNCSTKIQTIINTCIQPLLDQHKYYESQQQYILHCTRLINKKQYNECFELLYAGSSILYKYNEYNAATELVLLYINNIQKYCNINKQSDKEVLYVVDDIFNILKPCFSNNSLQANQAIITVSKAVLKYYETLANNNNNNNTVDIHDDNDENNDILYRLHESLAQSYTNIQQYKKASLHYVLSYTNSSNVVKFIEHIYNNINNKHEIQYFVCRIILQCIATQQLYNADQLLKNIKQSHILSSNDNNVINLPLLHYSQYLLDICNSKINTQQYNKTQLFDRLYDIYKLYLQRDSDYQQYIDRIGQLYCNKQAKSNGLLDLFSSLAS